MVDYDAVLVISFGGPEGPADVLPFLDNVTQGRDVPRSRILEVAGRYRRIGGISPINEQCRRLVHALKTELTDHAIELPVYWGNRNWHPTLTDTVTSMVDDGVRHALAFVTSAYSSHSSCRQYLDDIDRVRAEIGVRAPTIDKIRPYFNHPGFLEPFARSTRQAVDELGDRSGAARLVFTAHSIPSSMADTCDYQTQLTEAARVVAELQPGRLEWDLVWQSRSGPPSVPWLEPDINDHLHRLASQGVDAVTIVPIGFVFDHMEVIFDLDHEAALTADGLGIRMTRAATPATQPQSRFVTMCRELIEERLGTGAEPKSLGILGCLPESCPQGCCPST